MEALLRREDPIDYLPVHNLVVHLPIDIVSNWEEHSLLKFVVRSSEVSLMLDQLLYQAIKNPN